MSTSIPNDSDVDIFVDGLRVAPGTTLLVQHVDDLLPAGTARRCGPTGPTGPARFNWPGSGATGPMGPAGANGPEVPSSNDREPAGLSITEQFWKRVKQRDDLMAAAQNVGFGAAQCAGVFLGASRFTIGGHCVDMHTGIWHTAPPAAAEPLAMTQEMIAAGVTVDLEAEENGASGSHDIVQRIYRAMRALEPKDMLAESCVDHAQHWADTCMAERDAWKARAIAAEQRLAERDASVTRAIARQAR